MVKHIAKIVLGDEMYYVKDTEARNALIDQSEKGVAGGVATLDNSGKVPSSQLPESYAGVSKLTVGETEYNPIDGNITIPAYPTTLPASDVSAWAKSDTKPSYTKSEIGLGNVTNDAQVKRSEMGTASGVATLDSAGKVPSSQLPSYVDDVLEYDSRSGFPATGEGGKIYVNKSNNTTWRWSGTTYSQIKGDLVIGTTSGTVADGGTANSHYNNTSNPHNVTKAQVGLGNVANTGDSATPVSGGTTKFTTGGAYTELNKKVDKVSGKGLSTNDYTTDEKNKLSGIAAGAEVNVQSDWNATSGDAFIKNKPTIPSEVTESTVSGWGFTKNVGTVTGIKMNGDSKGTSGVVNLGTVITAHQDISGKVDKTTTVNGHALSGNVSVTKSDVGLGNVGNFKAVSTVASQGLSDTEKANARANIGAGTSSFSGSYNDLSNKPTIPAAAANGTYTVKTLVGSTTTNVSDFTANQSSADDVTFVQGSNVTITPDAKNRKITISSTDTNTWRPVGTGASDAAAGNHTHGISLATDSGTNQITLAHGTKYKLTAGGQSVIFTTPSDNNTTYSAGSGLSLSGTTFSLALTKALVTSALGYTPPTSDTNTWRPLGTGANDACAGNDPRLSNARPASDVYAWAKASSKPSYSWSEISSKPFNWNGQSGQPSWLWGSNDGTKYYVWNPSNFNVNYANSAGALSGVQFLSGNMTTVQYTNADGAARYASYISMSETDARKVISFQYMVTNQGGGFDGNGGCIFFSKNGWGYSKNYTDGSLTLKNTWFHLWGAGDPGTVTYNILKLA